MSKVEQKFCLSQTQYQAISVEFTLLYVLLKNQDELHRLKVCPVTFNQSLYSKTAEIVAASSNLVNIFVRLGKFHLLMSYLVSSSFVMALQWIRLITLCESVYAPYLVVYMMTGYGYSPVLWVHLLSAALLTLVLLENRDVLMVLIWIIANTSSVISRE